MEIKLILWTRPKVNNADFPTPKISSLEVLKALDSQEKLCVPLTYAEWHGIISHKDANRPQEIAEAAASSGIEFYSIFSQQPDEYQVLKTTTTAPVGDCSAQDRPTF